MLPIVATILVIIMLVGPVMMLRPSPTQKKQALLRSIAAKEGLIVSGGEQGANGEFLVRYILPNKNKDVERSEWVLKRQRFSHEGHFCSDWDWKDSPTTPVFTDESKIKVLLELNAKEFNSISVDRMGVSVAWTEKLKGSSEEDAVAKVKKFLTEVEALLS